MKKSILFYLIWLKKRYEKAAICENGFTESSDEAESGAKVAMRPSLWSGCCEGQ